MKHITKRLKTALKTAGYTLTQSDDVILCDTSGGAITITLPNANTQSGKLYTVRKVTGDVNAVTITGIGLLHSLNEQLDFSYTQGHGWTHRRYITSEWAAFTPTGAWTTATAYEGMKRRIGDSMQYRITVEFSGLPDASGFTIIQPTGETIDNAKLHDAGGRESLGTAVFYDASAGASGRLLGEVTYGSTTTVDVKILDTTVSQYMTIFTRSAPITIASGDKLVLDYLVPISGWGG